jgi:hypothetical protein
MEDFRRPPDILSFAFKTLVKVKVKGKIRSRTAMKAVGARRGWMFYAIPQPLYARKETRSPLHGRLGVPRAELNRRGISHRHRNSIPGPPVCSESLYGLLCPGPY